MTPHSSGWPTHRESAVHRNGREHVHPRLSLVGNIPSPPSTGVLDGSNRLMGGAHAAVPSTQCGESSGHQEAVGDAGSRREAADQMGAFAVWTLCNSDRSPSLARDYTHSALRGWGLEELDDSVAVAVSEMVTNAMCHNRRRDAGAREAAGAAHDEREQPVLLSLAAQGRSVLCVVVDAGRSAPEVRQPGELAESGRGLHIIECLSDDWGWTVPGPAGKAVWATFSTADSPSRAHCRRARGEALSRVLLLAGILRGTESCPPQPPAVHAPRTS